MRESTQPSRVEWVDVAKGMAILLVAVYHSALLLRQNGLGVPAWDEVNALFVTVRMPLFFLASGLFAASVIRRPWRSLWSSRLALLVWAFAVWTVLRFLYFTAVPMEARPLETSINRLLGAAVWPTSGLWFLHALVLFFVASKVMRDRVPAAAQLVLATVLSVVFFSGVSVGNLSYDGMARHFLFFLVGLHGKPRLLSCTERARPVALLVAVGVFASALALVNSLGARDFVGVSTALCALGLAASVLLARVLAAGPAGTPLAYLGRNTLPIYVAHVILIAATVTVLREAGVPDIWLGALPLMVAAGVVAASLALSRALSGTPLRWLYEVPPAVRFDPPAPAVEPARPLALSTKD